MFEDSKKAFENPPVAEWAKWDYSDWNHRLVEYCLGIGSGETHDVERLAATPEEISLVANAPSESADEIAKAFSDSCIDQIPKSVSFIGSCNRLIREKNWDPSSSTYPPFFGLLWLTCLVVYGYPSGKTGGFRSRFKTLLGKSVNLKPLPGYWRLVEDWAANQSKASKKTRVLRLPPEDSFRTNIGFSYFLAFPHEHDRRHLAAVLVEAELAGFEPPIEPVISELETKKNRFSSLFLEDLEQFRSDFLNEKKDPIKSPFWRAVRQESLDPSCDLHSTRTSSGQVSIIGSFEDDIFYPLLGCKETWDPPAGYQRVPLSEPINGFAFHIKPIDTIQKRIHEIIFRLPGALSIGYGLQAQIKKGVLAFQEYLSNDYYLASGHDINGAEFALVRNDLVEAFKEVFQGYAETSRVEGWSEVKYCHIKQLDVLPPGLATVHTLLRTTQPPTPRLVGGIRLGGSSYLGFKGFLPRVRAPEAEGVCLTGLSGGQMPCTKSTNGEWELPAKILNEINLSATLSATLEVQWKSEFESRVSQKDLTLSLAALVNFYRPLGSGYYFLESVRPEQKVIVGGSQIPLDVTSQTSTCNYDLLKDEPSTRYLGPGLGEMALDPRPGFDWKVVGPKNQPELLLFVGDPDRPTLPEPRRSPNSSDRRHWLKAFATEKAFVDVGDGEFVKLGTYPVLEEVRTKMKKSRSVPKTEECPATCLDIDPLIPPNRTEPLAKTWVLSDAIAALSSRRSGLKYKTVHQLFRELTISQYSDHLPHELIRAWVEIGALDLLRNQNYSETKLVARLPRFVAVRRGPFFEASLIGLVTQTKRSSVERLIEEEGLTSKLVKPGSPWQPSIIRVWAPLNTLEAITRAANLAPLEWFNDTLSAREFDIWSLQNIGKSQPPGFQLIQAWNWKSREFQRVTDSSEGRVHLEKRWREGSCSIYVVELDNRPCYWSYIRNWALLFAYEIDEQSLFSLDRFGWITTNGRSPAHLPLSLGRLNTILGEGLPGPTYNKSNNKVDGYCYPFGSRVESIISKVVPSTWLKKDNP